MKALAHIAIVIVVLMHASFARASTAEHAVTVAVAGESAEASALSLVLRDLLSRLGASVELSRVEAINASIVVDRPATFAPALARVWIDLRADDHAMIYLVDATWERVLVRRVSRDPEHLEVCREDIGHILETAIEAMLSGAKIGVERTTLQPPPPRPTPIAPRAREPAKPVTPQSTRALRVRAGVATETSLYATDKLVQALGVFASIETRNAGTELGGSLTIAYRLPLRSAALPIGVTLQGFEARLLAQTTTPLAPSVRLEVALGPGFDLVQATPISASGGASLAPPSADASFIVRVALGVRFRNVLEVLLFTDADATRHDFSFTAGATRARVVALSPFAVRPGIALAASF